MGKLEVPFALSEPKVALEPVKVTLAVVELNTASVDTLGVAFGFQLLLDPRAPFEPPVHIL